MLRKEKKTETITRECVVEHRCELCGCDLLEEGDVHETKEATISCKEVETYPGDAYETETIVDICVKCMREKVFPWLVSVGATVREEEHHY